MRLTRQHDLASTRRPVDLSWLARLTSLVVLLGLVGLLFTASRLTPDQRGSGTHRQLGLPPCQRRFAVWNEVSGLRNDDLLGLVNGWGTTNVSGNQFRWFHAGLARHGGDTVAG